MVDGGAPEAGTVIAGKYRVAAVLGSGGMSCLVKADHLLMKKQVAIKFLRSDKGRRVPGEAGAQSKPEGASRRLVREARAAQALASEHVVRVFDLGVHDEAPYIVMELLEGSDLAARVSRSGPLAIEDAVDAVLEACVAVAEAHAHKIFHRDLKPANLFASRTKTHEIIKVLDFGISKVPADEVEDCEKTSSEAMLGTPYYMSPEQLRNPSNVDGRTDIWALAVTLFFLLSGEHPFRGANRREVMAAVLTDPPAELRSEIPDGLREVIANAMKKRADDRTPTIHALATALLPFASKRGARAAERVLAIDGTLAKTDDGVAVDAPTDKLLTTDAGLSSTLPPTEEDDAAPAPPPPRAKPRSVALPAVAVFVAIGLAGAIWQTTKAPAVAPRPSATSVVASPPPSVAPSAVLSALTLPEPSAPPPKAVAPATVRVAPPPRPPAVTSASAAPPKTSAPVPRVDIDGVPIVE